MKHIAANGKDAVAVKEMLGMLSSTPQSGMDELAKNMVDEQLPSMKDIQDVTADFLMVPQRHGPDLLRSPYQVYRGIIQALLGYKNKTYVSEQVGILAGNNDTVLDVILGVDIQSTLTTPELIDRWDSLGYTVMGLVVWDDQDDPMKHVECMQELFSNVQRPLLLLQFGKSPEPNSWQFNDNEVEFKFVAVGLENKEKKRRKNADYRVIPVDQLGVTFDDEAAYLVSQAICKKMEQAVKNLSDSSNESTCFKKVAMPPDGYCLWHCILAGLQPQQYCKVLRHASGFAKNSRQEKIESQAAKNLLQLVVKAGVDENRFENGFVEIKDLALVADLLNLSIRCTISKEVRTVSYSICMWSNVNSIVRMFKIAMDNESISVYIYSI